MLPNYETSRKLFADYNLGLTTEMYERFEVYANFLVEYNKNVNLTAITEGDEILKKHFLDSAIMINYLDIPQNAKLADIGSGAGFPSIPMYIFRPDLKITIIDSLGKRITFLEQLCEKLGIKAELIHSRAEDCGKLADYREKFDISCARAVANMGLLSELCLPFVKLGGVFAAMKGPSEEIGTASKIIEMLGGRCIADTLYELEGDVRRLIVTEKISQTPTKYPRNSSQIKKKLI